MIEFDFTEEDKELIGKYKNTYYLMVNQLLINNAEVDVALLKDIENNVPISYNRENIQKNINTIKKIYEVMLKAYYKNSNRDDWNLFYGTSILEAQRLKNEIYIDNFLLAKNNIDDVKSNLMFENPTILNIKGSSNIPILNIDEILGKENSNSEFIISPFTKIKDFKEENEIIDNNEVINYNVMLEKQDLQELTLEEKKSVYTYILSSADVIDQKLQECVSYENEIIENNENIRKFEQLLSKYELEIKKKEDSKDYPELEKKADNEDIDRIKENLNEYKNALSHAYDEKKIAIDFITKWKKNLSVYIMAEFKSLEMEYEIEARVQNVLYNEKMKKLEEEAIERHNKLKEETIENIAKEVNKECDENIETSEALLSNVEKLIIKQQNHAKIAEKMGAKYKALINAFEIKRKAELLLVNIKAIKTKAKDLCENEDRTLLGDKLITVSNVNIQISTLLNYLNNPKSSSGKEKITRFDEMFIIEENELKRAIAEKILNVRGEAELKKLKDDLEILEEKGAFKRFIGFFTGSNKLDEVKEEQIEIRQKAIRKTLSQKMSLVYNYSIHELIAEIRMFLEDNEDDELIEDDIYILKNMEEELRRNFIISDSKVKDIILRKENKNLPIENRKIKKRELIEIETYRFLNKYGYDRRDNEEEIEYQDTMQNEIARIIDYINTSGVLGT